MEHQQLIIRSNRYLTATLLERKLISAEDAEQANAKLLSLIQADNIKQTSVLNILIYELKALEESVLINNMVDVDKAGLIHLSNIDLKLSASLNPDFSLNWATWSLPFDRLGNSICIATSYLLSSPVIEFWQTQFEKDIVWYATGIQSLTDALERLEGKTSES